MKTIQLTLNFDEKFFTSEIVQGNPRQAILLSYLAGIIDGEGCLRVNRMNPQNLPKAKNKRYSATIVVGMVEKVIPQLLQETLGGSLREECVPERRSIFRWAVTGRFQIKEILSKLLPYLIVKRPQAELLLELVNGWVTPYNKGEGLSLEELQRREDIYQRMCKLNAVGAAAKTEQKSIREDEATVWTNGKPLEGDSKQFPRQLRLVGS